jgi:predicted SAM-dependent methyltransferase
MTLQNLPQKLTSLYLRRLKNNRHSLKQVLVSTDRTRWLDMGSSSRFSEGFYFADLHPASETPENMRDKYFQFNPARASDAETGRLGKFHLIRMQHVFEHLTMEDGVKCLEKCHQLLEDDGYLLITVPDLKIFVKNYRQKKIHKMAFADWARTRIPQDAPESFYFSLFSHSFPNQQHMWCYDEEGLKYQLNRTKKFKNVERLSVFHPLADIPFTHNRPEEELCVLAQRA